MILSWTLFLVGLPCVLGETYWRRRWHASVLAGDWIYIDGGDVAYEYDSDGEGRYRRENKTYGLDLSKNWTNSSLTLIRTEKPPLAVSLRSASLWFDQKRNIIYSFGGDSYGDSDIAPAESIWGFTPDNKGSGQWNEVLGSVSTKPFPSEIHRPSSGASAADGSNAYYLGGFYNNSTSPYESVDTPAPGLLVFDFDTLAMNNLSDGGYFASQYNRYPTNPGVMIDVPEYGESGVLVILGGGDDTYTVGFNNITLYDKKSQKWYSQIASGEYPQPRFWFCGAGAQGSGDSFEIFIHGGVISQDSDINSDQVFILSLPAFRWFPTNYAPVFSRAGHTCHSTKSNQMIMIGGQHGLEELPADPWAQGIGVFDMNTLKFKNSYQANADPYEPPEVIRKYYSTGANRYPSSWTSLAVKDLFGGESNRTISPNSPVATPTALTTPSGKSSSRSMSNAAIAGIAIGCTAALLLFATPFIIKHMKKRRQKMGPKSTIPAEDEDSNPALHPYNLLLSELPALRKPQEILTEKNDCIELSYDARKYPPAELGT